MMVLSVTHPMTLDYHINQMPWRSILNKAVAKGYLSHQAGTCGLHVHISRNALGANYEEQEATIAKILYFYEKFWNEILTSVEERNLKQNIGQDVTAAE